MITDIFRQSLRVKLVAATTCLILLVVCILTGAIALYSTRALKTELDQQLSQFTSQGVETLSNFLDYQKMNLELWSHQPIVEMFFINKAWAVVYHMGLDSYFTNIAAKASWILDIMLIDQNEVIYEYADIFKNPSGEIAMPKAVTELLLQPQPVVSLDFQEFNPENKKPVLMIKKPFSKDGVVFPEKQVVVFIDLEEIYKKLFKNLIIGKRGFLTFAAITPEEKVLLPGKEQESETLEKQDFIHATSRLQVLSGMPEQYNSIFIKQRMLPDFPLVVIGVVSRNDFLKPVRNLVAASTIFGGVVLVIGIMVAFFYSAKLVGPLRHLTESVRLFSTENRHNVADLELSTLIRRPDEFGILANAFSKMFMTIRDYTGHLEEKIEERTKELELKVVERKRAEKQAKAANRAKSTFLANMSHELRTPLNAILGFSRLMERDPAVTKNLRENLNIINRSGAHLLDLINDVLDMSKIEAGLTDLEKQSFDLNRALTVIEEMIRSKTGAKELEFIITRATDLPRYIRTDKQKLHQVLLNLLGNAVKFTTQGSVALRVCVIDTLQSDIKHQTAEGTHLQFHIEDTGPGIAADEIEQIFDPFVQKQSNKSSSEGTGLGLAISRKFVRMMDGDISVKSKTGKGSIFSFDILVDVVDRTEIETEKPVRRVIGFTPEQPVYRILVVEDNPDNRALLSKLLQSVGFEIHKAINGQKAIEQYEKQQPDLIWMDIRMPVMDGMAAARKIREMEKSIKKNKTHVPIIALTAHAFEDEKEQILAAGCDDFVRKPFREVDLFDAMARHLDVRYVYEEGEECKVHGEGEPPRDVLTPEALAGLPDDLRKDLKQAIVDLDVDLIQAAIERIRKFNANIADALADFAKDFQYDKILDLI